MVKLTKDEQQQGALSALDWKKKGVRAHRTQKLGLPSGTWNHDSDQEMEQ